MKEVIFLLFMPKQNELHISIHNETYIVEGFIKDSNGNFVKAISDKKSKLQIVKIFINNLLNNL